MNIKYKELLKTIELLHQRNPLITLGLRATRHESESIVGTKLRQSYNWIDGVKQKNKLDGTCTVGLQSHDEVGLIKAIQIIGKPRVKNWVLRMQIISKMIT